MDWMKIGSAILLIGMFIFILPRAKHMLANSRKGSQSEWLNVALLLGVVVLFVFILIKLV